MVGSPSSSYRRSLTESGLATVVIGQVPYFEEREDVGDWFRRHGWDVTVTLVDELMAGYGRTAPKEVEYEVPENLFMAAQRT